MKEEWGGARIVSIKISKSINFLKIAARRVNNNASLGDVNHQAKMAGGDNASV
jgi:hypothetical protein